MAAATAVLNEEIMARPLCAVGLHRLKRQRRHGKTRHGITRMDTDKSESDENENGRAVRSAAGR
jgi:hypothetical protein